MVTFTHKMWSVAILYIMLASQHDKCGVDAFNTPRLLAKSSPTSAGSSFEVMTLTTSQRCRNNEILCLRATPESDGVDEKDEEEEEEELNTESSTTGLFIPGFSDKVAPPPKEEKKPESS